MKEFNQYRLLRFLVGAILFLTHSAASAASGGDFSNRAPRAVIDLASHEGVALVKGQWRYSDTKIVEVEFRAAGSDGQPTGAPNKTYDFTPHAGGAEFDDSTWEVLDPTMLDRRRAAGRLSFNWYRINLTIPDRIRDFDPSGSTVVFETSVDDYAEIWVDGEISRGLGQSGGSVIKGWNAANRLIVARNVKPGQQIQLAIFGINGPISNPPTNYIYMRYARLEFHPGSVSPVADNPIEVNVEVVRLDPAIDAIVPPNPKIFKLAEGFDSIQRITWTGSGNFLLVRDSGLNRRYQYRPDGALTKVRDRPRRSRSLEPSVHHSIDQRGHRYLIDGRGIKIFSAEGKHLGTIIVPKRPRHLAWGDRDGKSLFVATRETLYRMRLDIPGVLSDITGDN